MPRGDGTGPLGMGPMTGRAAGYCAGYPLPGYANPAPRAGLGLGLRCGQGRGRSGRGLFRWTRFAGSLYPAFGPSFSGGIPEEGFTDDKAYLLQAQKSLEMQLDYLGDQLKQVQGHLQELEKKGEK